MSCKVKISYITYEAGAATLFCPWWIYNANTSTFTST